jgi:hypothetical protein
METPDFIKGQQLEFRKTYRNWFKDISDNFPEYKKNTVKYYKAHMDDEWTILINFFIENASKYFETLSNLDYSFFDNCESFFSVIEYNKIMSSEGGLSDEYRKTQMAYLNKLSYMSIILSDSSKNTDDVYTQLLVKFITNIQILDGTNMENLMKNFEKAFNPQNFNEADKSFMNDNPLLSELAEEISKEIKIPESFKNIQNPQDIFKMMFNKEGKDFMEEMVKTVGGKIQDKIKHGQLNEKDLFAQAQQMMGTVFNNNPMFAGMGCMPGMADMGALAAGEDTVESTKAKKDEIRKKLKEQIKQKRS